MEHVPDDFLVFQNLFRALKPGGVAWILVPLWDKPTKDGGQDMTPSEREKHFGQWDHVRQFGPDLAERMQRVGFSVRIVKAKDAPRDDIQLLGLNPGDWIFVGKKPIESRNGE